MVDYFSTTALSDILAKLGELPTSIDLLRLRAPSIGASPVVDIDRTFQDNILEQLAPLPSPSNGLEHSSSTQHQPIVQILFLSSKRDRYNCSTKDLQVKRETLSEICVSLGVNTSFLEAILTPSIWSKQSCGSFERYNAAGEVQALDGFYCYFENWDLGPLHVWFSYDILTRSTTYILIDCPTPVKDKIRSEARSESRNFLLQPFAVDFLIAERCASWREVFINSRWDKLFEWHDRSSNRLDPPILRRNLDPENLQSLHDLSRVWSIIHEDLGDLNSRLEFLVSSSQSLASFLPSLKVSTNNAKSAFNFLLARSQLRQRWVSNFSVRTQFVSEFVYNVEAQVVNKSALENARENRRNSKINLDIQGLTAKIAEETAKDNSSMITIAIMTMFFLPGTLISAIFSMVFFNFSGTGSAFDVSPWVWLYFAVTIPLTGLVFAWYRYWSRRRERKVPSREGSLN